MNFTPPLIQATLIKRYKRFLADVHHPELGEFTVHCPNTGSMKNCWEEGDKIYLLDSQNPKRKYLYTWISSKNSQGHWLCLNTQLANSIVSEGLDNKRIAELAGYTKVQQEIKYGSENSRIDLLLTSADKPDSYVEIKTVTLLEEDKGQGFGYFPDSISTRGQKHLRELIEVVEQGQRAVLLFLVQHTGIKQVSPAEHIDPKYAHLLRKAADFGVEIIAYNTHIDAATISLRDSIPIIL